MTLPDVTKEYFEAKKQIEAILEKFEATTGMRIDTQTWSTSHHGFVDKGIANYLPQVKFSFRPDSFMS